MSMKAFKSAALALSLVAAAALPLSAQAAVEVGGVKFEDSASVNGQALQLNGAGLRVKMIIKVYALGLYVSAPESDAGKVLNQPGAKSVRIVMLRNVSGEDLAKSLVAGVADNATPAEQKALQERLDSLKSTLIASGEAKKGAVIEMNFLPGTGTRISMNGAQVGKDIAGEDFYRAVLKIWLGSDPADSSLKKDLLSKR